MLAGLEQYGCVIGAASANGTKFELSARDPRSDAASFNRKSIATVLPSAGAVGVVLNKRTETKLTRKAECAYTGNRLVHKSKLVIDGEDIDRDADSFDEE